MVETLTDINSETRGRRKGIEREQGINSFGLSAKVWEKNPLVCFNCMVALAKAPR